MASTLALALAVVVVALTAQEQGVSLKAELGEDGVLVSADMGRIRQLLGNLISNALRHTPEGGTVTVSAYEAGDEVALKVVDSGVGISAEQLPHIFNRFYRADKSRSRETGGTGLGLAIVKGIVEAHNGRVEAQSTGVNQGSAFAVYLP